MSQLFGTAVLVAGALFSLLTTWSSGTAPRQFADRLGLAISSTGGLNEIRAQYAGFFLAAAIACGAALASWIPRQAAFVMLIVIFGGLIVGRLASLAIDGGVAGYGSTIKALYAIDAVGLGLAVAALALDRQAS
jgi:hypothetical protein